MGIVIHYMGRERETGGQEAREGVEMIAGSERGKTGSKRRKEMVEMKAGSESGRKQEARGDEQMAEVRAEMR